LALRSTRVSDSAETRSDPGTPESIWAGGGISRRPHEGRGRGMVKTWAKTYASRSKPTEIAPLSAAHSSR
jgi:hypothetical protein